MPETRGRKSEPPPIDERLTSLPRPQIILFDWHGTLVNTLDAMYRAIEDMLARLEELDLIDHLTKEGESKTPEDARLVRYIRIFRKLHPKILAERRVSRTDIFDAIFGTDRRAIAIAHRAYDESYRKFFGEVTPFQDGVRAHLAGLASLGIGLGVATNRSREFLDAELARLEDGSWCALFATTVSGDEVESRKPAPDVLVRALERLGAEPSASIWYVGDSAADVAAARAAGITAVFYNGAFWDREGFERVFAHAADASGSLRPDAIIDDFDRLVDLVATSVPDDPGFRARVATARPKTRFRRVPPAPRLEPDWHPAIAELVPPKIILFDWHATLVDTLDAMYRAVDDTLPELVELGLMSRMVSPEASRSADDAKLVEYVRSTQKLHPKIKSDRKISRTDIFEVLFGNDEDAKRLAHATFNKHYRNHFGSVQPFEPAVGDVLAALRALGLKVGVITNRDREFFVEELAKVEGTGWSQYFDTAVCGDDTERRKPHPDQVLLAAKNLGVEASPSIWYVGDSTTDTIAAKAAGITSVFFNGAQWDQPWLSTIFPGNERYPYKPDVIVNDFSEFWAMTLACLGQS